MKKLSRSFLAVTLAIASAMGGAQAQTPGVTATEIKFGQTIPYSGPASAFAGNGMVQ